VVISKTLRIRTSGDCDIVDITKEVAKAVDESAIANGTITVFVTGSTAGVTTIEYETGLVADFKAMWERIAPGISDMNMIAPEETATGPHM